MPDSDPSNLPDTWGHVHGQPFDASLPGETQRALTRVNAAIRKIARHVPVPDRQFIAHFPRSILGAVKIECRGGCEPFRSMAMDAGEFVRFVEWANDHARCEPKEPTA
jgi:hypothetical protein